MTARAAVKQALTTAELAALLNVSARTVQDWRYGRGAGGPPYHLVGGQVRYLPDDVNRWLQKQRRTA